MDEPVDKSSGIVVIEGNILEQIRNRPEMFLGCRSLTALCHYLDGYERAKREAGAFNSDLLPKDFHDWVAYRLHFHEATSGFGRMILSKISDEAIALQRFFELLDEYHARKATLVARVHCHPAGFRQRQTVHDANGNLTKDEFVSCAPEVKVVVYTDDPGFFIVNDDPQSDVPGHAAFLPTLSWIHTPYRPDLEFMTILDERCYERLLSEQVAFSIESSQPSDKRKSDDSSTAIN